MASLASQIHTALLEDPILAPLHSGRVYRRPLKRSGVRSTPEAYDADGRLKAVSLVLTDEGDISEMFVDNRSTGLITIWIHGPDTASTQEAILDPIGPRIARILTDPNRIWIGYDGTGVEISISDRFGVREDPGHPDAILDYMRVSAAKLWRIE